MNPHALRQLAVDELPCDYCKADPGQWCHTVSGRRATWLHSSRTYALYQVYSQGFEDGVKDAVENPEWAARFVRRNP